MDNMQVSSTDTTLLDALTVKGVLVSVTVRYWRARKKLNPEDLGLRKEQVNDRLISLGHKRLLPKESMEALARIEGRAHALVEENSFPFRNGVARYLPNERIEDVTGKLEDLKAQFEMEKRTFMQKYAELRDQALSEWRQTAQHLVSDPSRLVRVIENEFPSPHRMDRYFSFDIQLFQVTVPEMPQTQLVDAGTAREIAQARQQAAQEARQRIEHSCDEFIQECVQEMRKQTSELCSDMIETINGKGYVHQKTLNRLIRFIDHFKQLNFMDDRQMEQQLENTRQQFLTRTAEEYRDSTQAQSELVDGLSTLRDYAGKLAHQDATELVEGFGQQGRRKFSLAA